MLYTASRMEEQAILNTAARMCGAARTAPKARGVDNILTLVLTGQEKDALADKMEEIALREYGKSTGHFPRDAGNLRAAQAVVLIGVRRTFAAMPYCSFCGFENCGRCDKAGGRCAFNTIDLGIALSSAVSIATDDRVDNRIMFSVGKAAEEMGFHEDGVLWHGIPISVSGKSPFFDRSAL